MLSLQPADKLSQSLLFPKNNRGGLVIQLSVEFHLPVLGKVLCCSPYTGEGRKEKKGRGRKGKNRERERQGDRNNDRDKRQKQRKKEEEENQKLMTTGSGRSR